ncbi:S8 family serine peptidase [Bowmanella denitrificans]|uniref:S8 family serine peptidase n=1 Tax=Bowmanella denitrificans TaxID=366582 RepID=UPI000C999AAE|nr:S8 family serine peptidase [Bowmanella denitrificans]
MFSSKYSKLSIGLLLGLSTLYAQADNKGPQPANQVSPPKLSDLVKKGRYIVRFQESAPSVGLASKARGPAVIAGGKFNTDNARAMLEGIGAEVLLSLPEHKMMAVNLDLLGLKRLSDNPQVASVEEDPRRYLMAQTTPYGIPMVQANQLSQLDTSARKVCIIDTGYNLGHPDLPDQNDGVTGQANNSQVGNWYNDGNGHGTHVAGTVAAIDNSQGVIGVYPGVNLHIVKIFNDSGNWTNASDLIAGIQQCQNAGANVVNMSLGGSGSSSSEQTAMQNFVNNGIMLVAAAGNSGNGSLSYPASYDAVISVAAVDSSENRASYSQYNNQVELAAPGSSVYSTYPTNTYATLSGTSMASPHTAGAAALVWSFHPTCSNEEIRNALQDTAKDKGSAGRDNYYGYGLVQAKDAVDYLNTYGCEGDDDDGGGDVDPVNGSVNVANTSTGNWVRYTWDIPAGVTQMQVSISGGSGDADLYMRHGSSPTLYTFDCRPYLYGNNETCTFPAPASGTWHIGVRAYSSFNNVVLNYQYY